MRLATYLRRRQIEANESIRGFARRAQLPPQTVNDILAGSDPRISTCARIVAAARAAPTALGEFVDFVDLATPAVAAEPERDGERGARHAVSAGV